MTNPINTLAEWDAEIATLRAKIDALAGVLQVCRVQFDFYAREHRKAGKHDKAATNEKFAFLCAGALTGVGAGENK